MALVTKVERTATDTSSAFIQAFNLFCNQGQSEEAVRSRFFWSAPSRLPGHIQHLARSQWSWITTCSTINMCSPLVKFICHNKCCSGRKDEWYIQTNNYHMQPFWQMPINLEQNRLVIQDGLNYFTGFWTKITCFWLVIGVNLLLH